MSTATATLFYEKSTKHTHVYSEGGAALADRSKAVFPTVYLQKHIFGADAVPPAKVTIAVSWGEKAS